MKKYLLIMSLLSFVFLGLGNVSLAQTANCHDGGVTCLATEACTLIPADGSFGSTDRYECVLKPTPTPDPSQTTTTQTNTDCLSSCLADPGLAAMEPTLRQDKCTQKCTTTGSVATPCNVVTSSLNGDPNAVVTALGVSCECKPLRGDYYDEV
ncbi:MAG: hypothetical protein NTX91_00475 [candidate division SR1 bacterium]|nr:hypothetical protein [candidate division SR1 bacterium]